MCPLKQEATHTHRAVVRRSAGFPWKNEMWMVQDHEHPNSHLTSLRKKGKKDRKSKRKKGKKER